MYFCEIMIVTCSKAACKLKFCLKQVTYTFIFESWSSLTVSLRWRIFSSAPVEIGPGADTASCTTGTGSLPGVKRPGRGVDHVPTSCVEVKERVELYLYTPSGPSWSVLRWNLTLIILSYRIFTYWRLTEVASEWFVWILFGYQTIRAFAMSCFGQWRMPVNIAAVCSDRFCVSDTVQTNTRLWSVTLKLLVDLVTN